eukprot:Awhi_evm1s11647
MVASGENKTTCLQTVDKDYKFQVGSFDRKPVGPKDVRVEIIYAGICHSDLHTVNNDWGVPNYPCVPGHEICGKVAEVGAEVKDHKLGDIVGVGCFVDSCSTPSECRECSMGAEHHCKDTVATYNTKLKDGSHTKGGYSSQIVVTERFVFGIPESLHDQLEAVAPLLCAGITTFSPLKRAGIKDGMKVGVVGMGGLGHMAIKIARAMGAEVTIFTRSEEKAAEASRLGATGSIISSNEESMSAAKSTFDVIIDSVSAYHDLLPYVNTLQFAGSYVILGVPPKPYQIPAGALIMRRISLLGSLVGGIQDTKDMLEFCGKHKIVSDVEVIPCDYIDKAYERLVKSDVKYRFVLDIANTLSKAE